VEGFLVSTEQPDGRNVILVGNIRVVFVLSLCFMSE
jgi:hypothetical protein